MSKYKILVIGLLVKSNVVKNYGEIVDEDTLPRDASALIKEGFIEEYFESDDAQKPKDLDDAATKQKELDDAAAKQKDLDDASAKQKELDDAAAFQKGSDDAEKALDEAAGIPPAPDPLSKLTKK